MNRLKVLNPLASTAGSNGEDCGQLSTPTQAISTSGRACIAWRLLGEVRIMIHNFDLIILDILVKFRYGTLGAWTWRSRFKIDRSGMTGMDAALWSRTVLCPPFDAQKKAAAFEPLCWSCMLSWTQVGLDQTEKKIKSHLQILQRPVIGRRWHLQSKPISSSLQRLEAQPGTGQGDPMKYYEIMSSILKLVKKSHGGHFLMPEVKPIFDNIWYMFFKKKTSKGFTRFCVKAPF